MKRCALLTTEGLEDFFVYDEMLIEPLKEKGWLAHEVSWRDASIDWNVYDVVVIRSTWDYQQHVDEFLTCLRKIEASSARLENSLSIVEWNISKEYLKDLQNQGVAIVPTVWFDGFDEVKMIRGFNHFGTDEIVIKPLISAGADDTYRLSEADFQNKKAELKTVFCDRGFMLQPFLNNILEDGEYSLFYFCGDYSHTILKQPKSGDFRVQEEHGGQLQSVEPNENMLQVAEQCLAALPENVLYARVDLISYQDEFVVIEVELIEPSLYFNMDPASPQRFAAAFAEQFKEH